VARLAAADPRHRALALERTTFFTNDWVSWRARTLTGNLTAVEQGWSALMTRGLALSPGGLRAFAVDGLTAGPGVPIDSSQFDVVAAFGAPVLRLKRTLPRAYAVPRVVAPGNDDAIVATVVSPGFSPADSACVDEPAAAGDYPGSRECRLRWVADDPDRLELAATARAPAFLVVADAWDAGWAATLDGRPASILHVNRLARGIVLPAGEHRVIMRYTPPGWAPAMATTRIALALTLALAIVLVPVMGRRRARAATGFEEA
jgi:hypothetical protein